MIFFGRVTTSLLLAALTVLSSGVIAKLVPLVDDCSSLASRPNGIPLKVAPSIYVATDPLGTYADDLSRYARKDENHALITYSSLKGFQAVTIVGLSREQSEWAITVSYSVDNQPQQQNLYGNKDVKATKVVDASDPSNRWLQWTLNVTITGACPKILGIVLSDSDVDKGWGLQVAQITLWVNDVGCPVAKSPPPLPPSPQPTPTPSPPTVVAPLDTSGAELQSSDCLPKAESVGYCSTPPPQNSQTTPDSLDSLGLTAEHSNVETTSEQAKEHFANDKGRIKRSNPSSPGWLVYHIDNGIQRVRITYFQCGDGANLLVVPFYGDSNCASGKVSVQGTLERSVENSCWKQYTADVWLNDTKPDPVAGDPCPPSDVKLMITGGSASADLHLGRVQVDGYGVLSSSKQAGSSLFSNLQASGSTGSGLLPTRAWIPIVSCILGGVTALVLFMLYKCGRLPWLNVLLGGSNWKDEGMDEEKGKGKGKGKSRGKGKGKGHHPPPPDMEAPPVYQRFHEKPPTVTALPVGWAPLNGTGRRVDQDARALHDSQVFANPMNGTHATPSASPKAGAGERISNFSSTIPHFLEPQRPPPIRTRAPSARERDGREGRDPTPPPRTLSARDSQVSPKLHRNPTHSPTGHPRTPTRDGAHTPPHLQRMQSDKSITPREGRERSPRDRLTPRESRERDRHTPRDSRERGFTPRSSRDRPTTPPFDAKDRDGRDGREYREGTPPARLSPHGPPRTPEFGAAPGQLVTPSVTPTHIISTPKEGKNSSNSEGGKVLEERLADLQKKIVEIKKYLSQRKPDSCTTNDKKLIMLKRIGQGGFGVVWKATWEGTVVAVKIMVFPNNMSGEEKAEKMALMEMAISGFLTHPNIVQTFTCEIRPISLEEERESMGMMGMLPSLPSLVRRSHRHKDKGSNSQWMDWSTLRGSNTQDSTSFFSNKDPTNNYSWELRIIMEYCDAGTLKDALKSRRFLLDGHPGLMMDHVLLTALDIARGVKHLHEHQVIHGDLKPHNILLRRSKSDARGYVAKIADFGLSIKMQAKQTIVSGVTQGTDGYMSPEVIHQNKVLPASDVYSYGIMLWEIYTCRAVHDDLRSAKLPKHLITKWRPSFPPNCPGKYVNLAQQCWDPNPYNRPAFKTVIDELSEMLKLVRRQSVKEAKELAEAASRGVHSSAEKHAPPEAPPPEAAPSRIIFPQSDS